MTITAGQLSIIITIGIFVMGGIFGLISFLLKNAVFVKLTETTATLQEVKKSMHEELAGLGGKLTEFKEEVIKEYVRRVDLVGNELQHKEFYEKIGKQAERIAVLESENRALKATSYQYRRGQMSQSDRRLEDNIQLPTEG